MDWMPSWEFPAKRMTALRREVGADDDEGAETEDMTGTQARYRPQVGWLGENAHSRGCFAAVHAGEWLFYALFSAPAACRNRTVSPQRPPFTPAPGCTPSEPPRTGPKIKHLAISLIGVNMTPLKFWGRALLTVESDRS